ncbi:MAG: hypothetical protein AAF547_11095 [Actinomycetota bacterium]
MIDRPAQPASASTAAGSFGLRADWRFLLPSGPHRHVLVVGSAATNWGYLVEDSWTERLSTDPAAATADGPGDHGPDVVVVDGDADPAPALAAAGPHAVAVIALGRNPRQRIRRLGALGPAGFTVRARYLATPDLAGATRLVPIDRSAAIRWLLAPPPPVPGTGTGLRRRARVWTVAAGAAAVAGATGRAPGWIGRAIGAGADGLVIAERTPTDGALPILMTSGHDEGSRAVLVDPPGTDGGGTVTKVAPRPRYNGNVEAEIEVIAAVRDRVGQTEAELLPAVIGATTVDGLAASVERYAGRWTAADLCHRVPAARSAVLDQTLGAIDRLANASVTDRTAPWTADRFDELIGDLFDQVAELTERGPDLTALRDDLTARSGALVGRPLPMVQRHYDLGPWNVVVADDGSALTIVDWELAPPRALGRPGPAGADQITVVKYWLHAALATASIDEELAAFEFLAAGPEEPRAVAAAALRRSFGRIGVDPGFVPLLMTHAWLEKARYTAARRAGQHGTSRQDPGPSVDYLAAMADHRATLLRFWP